MGVIQEASSKARISRKLKALDLFCGAGGSSVGATMAGIEVVGGIDRWPLAAMTFKSNFPNAEVLTTRLERLSSSDIQEKFSGIDLLLASPECTNHTPAKGAAPRSEESRRTAFQVSRIAKLLSPRWVVVENVSQMKCWDKYQTWMHLMSRLGYKAEEQILDSSDFGVPQSRKRLFILFDKIKHPPKVLPLHTGKKTSVKSVLNMNGTYKFSVLNTKKRAAGTKLRAMNAIRALRKSGEQHLPFLLVYYGSDGAGGWQRLDRPLRTITTVDRFALVRWLEGRYRMRMLQVAELKPAMGFPEWFELNNGSRRERIAMLGNGVCPPVMKAIIETLVNDKEV